MSSSTLLRTHHLPRNHRAPLIVCAAAAALAAITTAPAAFGQVTIHGGPTFTPGVGGFKDGGVTDINNAGTAVGAANKYLGSSVVDSGYRPFRWDSSGAAAIELGNLGVSASGFAYCYAGAINDAGTAVGEAQKYDGASAYSSGYRPVRWTASDIAATELGTLGLGNYLGVSNYTESGAYAINSTGTAVGYAFKFDVAGEYNGIRAVRWDASGTAATELGGLGGGVAGLGSVFTSARAINDAGTAVGDAGKFDTAGAYVGTRPVRWEASGTTATELGILGVGTTGYTESYVYHINDAGTAVGSAIKFNGGVGVGQRAVRWDASSTTATELGTLGTNASGYTESFVNDINGTGTAVGFASKYDGSGVSLGSRAVRWDAFGTAATELGTLGTNPQSFAAFDSVAAINNAGIAVGSTYSATLLRNTAVYWGLDGTAVDLNALIDPGSGWTLYFAGAITDTGWIGGSGDFDPDGPGGQAAYIRAFLIHVPATAVPEPATAALLGAGLTYGMASRRRVG